MDIPELNQPEPSVEWEAAPDSDLFDPARLEPADQRALLIALLFSTGEVVDATRLSEFLTLEPEALTLLIEETAGELRLVGLDILGVAGGYRLVTAAQWDSYLAAFHRQVRKAKLSKSALEVLAIIAYEQPAPRTRVDELRQVNSESTVRMLLERRLITVAGRADTAGRPFLYRTTDAFLETFGLGSLSDLPPRPASLDLPTGRGALGMEGDEEEAATGLDDLPDFSELPDESGE